MTPPAVLVFLKMKLLVLVGQILGTKLQHFRLFHIEFWVFLNPNHYKNSVCKSAAEGLFAPADSSGWKPSKEWVSIKQI